MIVCTFKVEGQAAPRIAAAWGEASSARELMRGMLSERGNPVPGEEIEPGVLKARGLSYVGA